MRFPHSQKRECSKQDVEEPNRRLALQIRWLENYAGHRILSFILVLSCTILSKSPDRDRFLRERGGSASKKEIYRALGDDVESRQMIDEKLRMMERFGLVAIDGEEVSTK